MIITRPRVTLGVVLVVVVVFHLLLDDFLLLEGLPGANAIKLGFLGIFVLLALLGRALPSRRDPFYVILACYLGFFLVGLMTIPASENPLSSLYGSVVFFTKVILTLVLLGMCFSSKFFDAGSVATVWAWAGALMAFQSILLFVLVLVAGVQLPQFAVPLPRLDDVRISFSFLGFFDSPPRVQSYFSEANKFAQFLLVPAFYWWAKVTGRPRPWLAAAVTLALLLTFSWSAIGALLVGALLLKGLLIRSAVARWTVIAVSMAVLAAGGFWVVNRYFLKPSFETELVSRTIYRSGSVQGKGAMLTRGFAIASAKPLGVGMIRRTDAREFEYGRFNTASGIFMTLASTGWPGLLLRLMTWVMAWIVVVRAAALARRTPEARLTLALGVAFISLTVASTTHGPFDQRPYLILLMLLLASARRDGLFAPAAQRA